MEILLSNLDLYIISFIIYPRAHFPFILLATETILILLQVFMYMNHHLPYLNHFSFFFLKPIPCIKRQMLISSQNTGFPKVRSSLIFFIIFKNLKHGYNTYIKLTQIFFFFFKENTPFQQGCKSEFHLRTRIKMTPGLYTNSSYVF